MLAGESFEFPVVPLGQIRIDFTSRGKAREFAGAVGALKWAGEYVGNLQGREPHAEPEGVSFADFCQAQVRQACVLAGFGPGRFAMTHQIDGG